MIEFHLNRDCREWADRKACLVRPAIPQAFNSVTMRTSPKLTQLDHAIPSIETIAILSANALMAHGFCLNRDAHHNRRELELISTSPVLMEIRVLRSRALSASPHLQSSCTRTERGTSCASAQIPSDVTDMDRE
jgi:hypothetical protein